MRKMKFSIYKYNPEIDKKPYLSFPSMSVASQISTSGIIYPKS